MGLEAIGVLHPQQAVDHAGVFIDHAFGLAGGAGGVDHIGLVPGGQARHLRVARALLLPGDVIQVQHRHVAQQLAGRVLRQHHHRCAVLQHVSDAFEWIRRVQRHITATRLKDREQADHHVQATLDANTHARIRLHAEFAQVMGQAVGAFVECPVGQLLVTGLDRHRIRGAFDLSLEQAVQGLVEVVSDLGGVERYQQFLAFLGAQDRQAIERLVRCLLQGFDQPGQGVLQVTTHPLRVNLRQGGDIVTIAQVIHVEGQRVVGAAIVDQRLHAFPGVLRLGRTRRGAAMAIVEHRAEQRRRGRHPAATLGQGQGRVLMAEQRGEPRVGGTHGIACALRVDIQAQRQGIDKHPERTISALTALQSADQHGAEHHAVAPRSGRQHLAPGQVEQARRAHTEYTCLGSQAAVEVVVQVQAVFLNRAAVAAHVLQAERQGRFIDIGEHLAKERLVLLLTDAQSRLGHVVAVRHRRRRRGGVPQQMPLHFTQHHVERGVVQRNMVIEQHHHHALVGRVLGVLEADKRRLADVQAITPRIKTRVQAGEYIALQLQLFKRQSGLAPHHLQRLRKAFPDHTRAQDVMAVDHLLQRMGEGLQALEAVEGQVRLQQVRVALFGGEVVVKNALLQRRQRVDILHIGGATGDAADGVIEGRLVDINQGQHVRRDAQAIGCDPVRRHLHFAATAHGSRQRGQGRLAEQHTDIRAEVRLTHAFDQAHGQQRMAAELEEVVMTADLFDLQHLGPDPRQGGFHCALGRFKVAAEQCRLVRFRQGLAIQLAVGGQGQCVELDVGHRHQRVGQLCL